LTATIEACLDRKDYGWGWLACGALGNFQVLDSKLVEHVLPILIRVIEETAYNNTDVSTDKLNMRRYSILALGNYGNLATPALLKLAHLLEHRHDPLWQTYFDAAQKIDPRAKSQVDALIVSLSSRDAPTRGEAVCLIAKLGNAGISAISELLSLLNDQNFDVRRFLAIALGKLGQRTSEIVSVLDTLTHDPDDSVKVGAFYSLICLGENQQSNLHRVLSFLSHNDPFVRHLTAWAVGEIGAIDKDNAISCLMGALRLEDHPRNKDLIAESIEKIRKC
jgi:HEAT repeat protein